MFVFMVVDMMKNCGWFNRAEEMMEYVGGNVGIEHRYPKRSKRNGGGGSK